MNSLDIIILVIVAIIVSKEYFEWRISKQLMGIFRSFLQSQENGTDLIKDFIRFLDEAAKKEDEDER